MKVSAIFLIYLAWASSAFAGKSFLDEATKDFPKAVCAETQFFKKCYGMKTSTCEKQLRVAADYCLLKSPDGKKALDGKTLSEPEKENFGSCIGDRFKATNQKRQIASAECGEFHRW